MRLKEIFLDNDGALTHKWDHYFSIYERYLAKFKDSKFTIVEVGVQDGGSLHNWRKYFGEKANIIGVDILQDCKSLESCGFHIEIGDQGDPEFWDEFCHRYESIDVVIDDGSHQSPHQILTFEKLFPIINQNGVFICEDVHSSYSQWFDGGPFKNGTFVEYAKGLVDELNGWWGENSAVLYPTQLTRTCGGIFFHDSIVVLEKESRTEPGDLISGNFSSVPSSVKPYPEGPYLTREVLQPLPLNSDGTKSLYRVPKAETEMPAPQTYPSIGSIVRQRWKSGS